MREGGWVAEIVSSYFSAGPKKLVLVAAILVDWHQVCQVRLQVDIFSPNKAKRKSELRKLAKLCRACGLDFLDDTEGLHRLPFLLFPFDLRIGSGAHPVPVHEWECEALPMTDR
ncbi:MAG: hypothetical protein ACLP1W_14810 [Rhodomicrobium sp.]